MNQDFNKSYIGILKDLYKSSQGLYSFSIYSKYKISPKEFVSFMKRYSSKGYIIYEEDRLTLTDEGRKMVFLEVFYNKYKKGLDSNLPENYLSEKINVNKPYIPIINYLCSDFKE